MERLFFNERCERLEHEVFNVLIKFCMKFLYAEAYIGKIIVASTTLQPKKEYWLKFTRFPGDVRVLFFNGLPGHKTKRSSHIYIGCNKNSIKKAIKNLPFFFFLCSLYNSLYYLKLCITSSFHDY